MLEQSLLVALFLMNAGWAAAYDVTTTQSLFTNLTSDYNIFLQPYRPVDISIEFSILSVNSLDVKEQTFSVTGYITAKWYDSRLLWTAVDYGNVTVMFFTDAHIWKPELVIQNSAVNVPVIDDDALYLKVKNTGNVTWDPPGVYVVNCDVDVTYYPFDTQTCYIAVSTWSHDDMVTNLVHSKTAINFEDYQENGEWTMLDSHVLSATKKDRNDAGMTRASLQFYFELKRKTPYYVVNFVLPPMVTSLLDLMTFLIPPESGEKVGFSITVLLALAVLLTMTTDYIPSTSKDTSLYSTYLLCNLLFSAIEIVLAVVVLRLHHNHDRGKPVPEYVQKIARTVLARTSCFNSCFLRSGSSHLAEMEHVPKRSQISPDASKVNDNGIGSDNFTSVDRQSAHLQTGEKTLDIQLKRKADFSEIPDVNFTGYTWAEVAIMVDNTAFLIMLMLLIGMTVGFNVALAIN